MKWTQGVTVSSYEPQDWRFEIDAPIIAAIKDSLRPGGVIETAESKLALIALEGAPSDSLVPEGRLESITLEPAVTVLAPEDGYQSTIDGLAPGGLIGSITMTSSVLDVTDPAKYQILTDSLRPSGLVSSISSVQALLWLESRPIDSLRPAGLINSISMTAT